MILNSPYISGSLTVTGNTTIQGQLTVTGSLSGTASLASNALLLQGTGSTGFATTSSLLQVSSSQQQISSSLLQVSASYIALSGSYNVFSASNSTILTAVSSSQQQISSSYIALSGSYNVFSGSASTRITENSSSIQQVSSSQQQISSSQQQISASLLTLTASYTALSASYTALSGSYNTFSGSASTRVTQIEQVYATTGSNSFRANQSITGSLVVSSTITAQTLVVQTVTSSIVYSSGSNNFGNQLSNNQTFTGSVNITGSLALAGNITSNAVTLTGALGGTSATFSLASTGSGAVISVGNVGSGVFGGLAITDGGTYPMKIWGSELQFLTGNSTFGSATTRLTIASTGAATFSGTVNVYDGSSHGLSISNSSGAITFTNNWAKTTFTVASAQDIEFNDDAGVKRLFLKNGGNVGIGTNSPASQVTGATTGILDVSAATGGNLVLHRTSGGDTAIFSILKASNGTYIDSTGAATAANNAIYFRTNNINADQTSLTTALTIASTGAATFSSTISAGAATFSGKVIGNGFNSFSGDVSIASGASSIIYTMGDNGLYTVSIIVTAGSLIYSAAAIFYAHNSNAQFVKALDLYDGANVTLDNSGSGIRITNNGFSTLTWSWSILHQKF